MKKMDAFILFTIPLSLKTYFSKTLQQKLKVKLYSDRARLTLQEYMFTFNFYREAFDELVFKV